MNAIRSEKISLIDDDLVAVANVEPGVRDFVPGDAANLRGPASATDMRLEPSPEASVNSINLFIERIAGPSLTQIENLVSELGNMREMLNAEAHRVRREMSDYGRLSQSAMETTRMLAQNVSEWKRAADGLRNG